MSSADGSEPTARDAGIPEIADFAAGVAHEFANPLNAITMNVELARMMIARGQTERLSDVLGRLVDDCRRTTAVVQGVQRYASGMTRGAPEETFIKLLVEEAAQLARKEMPSELYQIQVTPIDPAVAVIADRRGLQRALANVIRNAIEADATRIELSTDIDDQQVQIACCDNGSGIGPRELPLVFDAFYSSRRAKGASGLGLSCARAVLAVHGGELYVESSSPTGTRVEMMIPRGNA
jgi:signal transduction histidine kinase